MYSLLQKFNVALRTACGVKSFPPAFGDRHFEKLTVFDLLKLQTRGHKNVPKKLKTKSAAKKRFKVTANGHLKCWPSSRKGKALIIRRKGARGPAKHLLKLLPNSKWSLKSPARSKSQYLIQDIEFDGIK